MLCPWTQNTLLRSLLHTFQGQKLSVLLNSLCRSQLAAARGEPLEQHFPLCVSPARLRHWNESQQNPMSGGSANAPFCSQAPGGRPRAGTAEDGHGGEMALQFFGVLGREEMFLRHQTPWMPLGVSGACQILPSFLPLICNAAVCYLQPSISELAAFLCYSEVWKYFEIFIQ